MKQLDAYKVQVLLMPDAASRYVPEDVDEVLYRIQKQAEADDCTVSMIFDVRDIYAIRQQVSGEGAEQFMLFTDFGEVEIDPSEFEPLCKLWMKRTYKRT